MEVEELNDDAELGEPETGNGTDRDATEETAGADHPEGDKPAAKPAKKSRDDSNKELESAERRIKELQASERYWQERATRGGAKEKDAEEEPDEDAGDFDDLLAEEAAGEELTPDQFLDELTAKGPKAIAAVLQKHGYMKKSDVVKLAQEVTRRSIAKERGKISIDARIGTEFSDLQDSESDLYKETQKIYREMVALDPKLQYRPSAVLLAAKAAKGALAAKNNGNVKRSTSERDDDDRASERSRRIRAQQGETGRGGRTDDDMEEDMGPEARFLAQSWAKTAQLKPDELLGAVRESHRKGRRR